MKILFVSILVSLSLLCKGQSIGYPYCLEPNITSCYDSITPFDSIINYTVPYNANMISVNSMFHTFSASVVHWIRNSGGGGSGVDTATPFAAGALSNYQAKLLFPLFADTAAGTSWTKKYSSLFGLHDSLILFKGTTNIVTLGTITTGTWQGTRIGATYGGTGINNGSYTITLGGSLNFNSNAKGYAYNHGSGLITYDTTRAGSSGWGLTGNSGTSPGTNFIGTTDAQDFEFKTNNIISGYIAYSGHHATFFGNGAGANSVSVDNCSVFGWGAVNTYTSGSGVSAFGVQALQEINAANCTAIGFQAGNLDYSGASNTFLGASTNISTNSFTDATAIGYGAIDSASYEIKLGDNNIKTVRLGSGTFCLPIQVSTATSGTVVCNGNEILRLTGAASALTITMPTPVNGMILIISTNQTSITLSFGSGANFDVTPTVVTHTTPIRLFYDASTATWANE